MARRLALIIGNSVYMDKTLARLKAPDADVGALHDVLKDPDLGGFDDVKLLVNVTSTTVRQAISEFFSQKTRDDLLLLYFSGHGVLDDRGRLYLAVKDTNRKYLRANAIPAAFISDEMDNSRSQRQVLILDCCHSGAFARGSKGVTGASVGTASAFEGNGYGRVVLTATDATQYAWEGDQIIGDTQTSLFTHFLTEGLHTGEADSNIDGKITVDELYDYVYERIVKLTPKQTPGKWSYREQGEMVIALSKSQESLPEAALPIPEVFEEVEQRLEKLYYDGLSAFWLEDWERAIHSFQAILEARPDYEDAAARLEDARKQKRWQDLYTKAQTARENKNWAKALAALEALVSEAGEYRDSRTQLERVKQHKHLADLYAEAHHLFQAEKWPAVVKILAQITAVDPEYPDPKGLRASARQKVEELERQAQMEDLYRRALLEMDAGRWLEAQNLLKEIQLVEPGFEETGRLLEKVEVEIRRVEEQKYRQDRIQTLYEQAHGLVRSKSWRKALDKVEEILELDDQFEDKDGIAKKASAALELEQQEVQKQNQLAAMYAESVRLMSEDKYQEALDKLHAVKAVDARYPDRQGVQKTAKKKLRKRPNLKQVGAWSKRMLANRRVAIGALIALILLGAFYTGYKIWAPRTLFYDDFNQATLRSEYVSPSGVNQATPSYSFESLDGYSVIRLSNILRDNEEKAWEISKVFDIYSTPLRIEIRFNTLRQGTATSIDSFLNIWLKPADYSDNVTVELFAGNFGRDRDFAGIPFPFEDQTWYRLVITGTRDHNYRASLFDDLTETELVGKDMGLPADFFKSGMRMGISQRMGTPGGVYPVDVAIDWIKVTANPWR